MPSWSSIARKKRFPFKAPTAAPGSTGPVAPGTLIHETLSSDICHWMSPVAPVTVMSSGALPNATIWFELTSPVKTT